MGLDNKYDLLLLAPYVGEKVTDRFLAPPLGIHLIACFVRYYGYKVKVIDLNLTGEKFLFDLLKKTKFNFIGFSLTHYTLEHDINILFKVKSMQPNSVLIIGGPEATCNYHKFFEIIPYNVISVLGPGEFITLEILNKYRNNLPLHKVLKDVSGIKIKDNNKLFSTCPSIPYDSNSFTNATDKIDFINIPFREYWSLNASIFNPDHLKIMGAYIKTLRLFTSLRCKNKCIFCAASGYEKTFSKGLKIEQQELSSHNIYNLISKALKAYPDCEAIFINDDTFLQNKNRALELCELIISQNHSGVFHNDVKYLCQARTDQVDLHLLKTLKGCGFKLICYGVESFSQKILNFLRKGTTVEQNEKAIINTVTCGIDVLISLILFPPVITIKDLELTIDKATYFVNKYGIKLKSATYINSIPGSIIHNMNFQKESEMFKIPYHNNMEIEKETILYPIDKDVREFTKKVINCKKSVSENFVKEHSIDMKCHNKQTLDTLLLFYTIYDLLNNSKKNYIMDTMIGLIK